MKPAIALKTIKERGACLVYPLNNSREIPNLWHAYFPRSRMSWDWNDDGDDRVANLWMLRAQLFERKDIAYLKLYQGRATFCSLEVFRAVYHLANSADPKLARLSATARQAHDLLLDNSPRSTKALRKDLDLGGRHFESTWQRTLKELWQRALILGVGEVDDGAFPSLAVGAAELLQEAQVKKARTLSDAEAWKILRRDLGEDSAFYRYFQKNLGQVKVARARGLSLGSR